MILLESPCFLSNIGRRYGMLERTRNLPKLLILKNSRTNQRHIPYTGIMLRIMKSMCICKMGIPASKRSSSFIHFLQEDLISALHMCTDCV